MTFVEVTGWNPQGESVAWSTRVDDADEDAAIEAAVLDAKQSVELVEIGDCVVYHGFRPASFVEPVAVAPSPSGLSLSSQPREDCWIAEGLHRRWRVVSEFRTFGEWDALVDAQQFLALLVAGNGNLTRLA